MPFSFHFFPLKFHCSTKEEESCYQEEVIPTLNEDAEAKEMKVCAK